MNKQEMINAVISRGPEDDNVLITDWLNEGYMQLAKTAKLYTEGAVLAQSSYRLYTLPINLIQLLGVKVDNKFLTKISETDIGTETGTPTNYYKYGHKLGLYPAVNTDTEVTILYYEYPDKLNLDTDSPVIPEEYHGAIVNFAIARAYEADEEFDSSAYFMQQFEKAKAEFEKAVNDDDPTPTSVKLIY